MSDPSLVIIKQVSLDLRLACFSGYLDQRYQPFVKTSMEKVRDNGEPGTMTYERCHDNGVIHLITKVFSIAAPSVWLGEEAYCRAMYQIATKFDYSNI